MKIEETFMGFLEKMEANMKEAHEVSIVKGYDEIKSILLRTIIDINLIKEELSHKGEVEDCFAFSSRNTTLHGGKQMKSRIEETKRDDVYIISYFLSKYEHNDLLPSYNQTEAINYLSKILDINMHTLRQYRDAFDPYTGSHRKGYWQGALNYRQQQLFDQFEKKDKAQMIEIAKKTISKYISNI